MVSGISIEQFAIERVFVGLAEQASKDIPARLERQKKRVIVISGPTASGKSELALQLAQEMDGEIITGDSCQIYKGMDIGTAKPTLEEQERVPHHLIDIRKVTEPFSVVDFYYEARHACMQILAKEKVPIVVGGSGFYLHSLIYGPPSGPPSVPELRRELEREYDEKGSMPMYEQLCQLDQEYANSITKNDKQKVVRALEIIKLSGSKVSQMAWKARKRPQNYDFRCWFLHRPRDRLYHRIDKRCEKMVEMGLLEEVERLKGERIEENRSASQAIGYRHILRYLQTERTKEDFHQFMESFKQDSRHYAKRQLTWFRKQRVFRWLDLDLHDPEVVRDIIKQDYELAL